MKAIVTLIWENDFTHSYERTGPNKGFIDQLCQEVEKLKWVKEYHITSEEGKILYRGKKSTPVHEQQDAVYNG